ncbi:MAG: glutamyl-tRNA synthetase [Candidatus Promineifilaceae bacterium]|jgi:glutamyl-tRNA synthetase
MSVRVRFAPSPTGQVHIGNIRTAIFNYLFARHENGKFLLRVEDTDRERSNEAAVKGVLDAMEWLGLDVDEEPMFQSTRTEAHLAVAQDLLDRGLAYKADKGDTGKGEAIIFRMPEGALRFVDVLKGELTKSSDDVKDLVIVRSNGAPVFHLANVVDDIEMGITHVIRGDDHIENTYRHVALYEALGAPVPSFCHLPMIVNQHGKPYSKRDGSAFVGEFRETGYLPDAFLNYLSLLGWSPGDDLEVMDRQRLIGLFSLDRIRSSASQMDTKKLMWMNGEYMRALPRDVFSTGFDQALSGAGFDTGVHGEAYQASVVALMQERTKLWADIGRDSGFFFTEAFGFDPKAARKRLLKDGAAEVLVALRELLLGLQDFSDTTVETAVRGYGETNEIPVGNLVNPLRVACSGLGHGPGLFEMLSLLGQDRVCARIERACALILTGTFPEIP